MHDSFLTDFSVLALIYSYSTALHARSTRRLCNFFHFSNKITFSDPFSLSFKVDALLALPDPVDLLHSVQNKLGSIHKS